MSSVAVGFLAFVEGITIKFWPTSRLWARDLYAWWTSRAHKSNCYPIFSKSKLQEVITDFALSIDNEKKRLPLNLTNTCIRTYRSCSSTVYYWRTVKKKDSEVTDVPCNSQMKSWYRPKQCLSCHLLQQHLQIQPWRRNQSLTEPQHEPSSYWLDHL